MKKTQRSNPNGALKGAGTGIQQDTQSTNAGSPYTSDTLGISLEVKSQTDSQLTPKLLEVRTIMAFAAKLGDAVFWREFELADGKKVYALCFPFSLWKVDNSNSLRPR